VAQRPSAVGLNGMQILRRDPAQDRRGGRIADCDVAALQLQKMA